MNWKDGRTAHPLYSIWKDIIYRCYDPRCAAFRNYGGRGITVCKRWLNSFWSFVADVGRRPSRKHSIDRKNNNGNYTPKNVHWATSKEQNRNSRRNHVLTANGKTQTLAAWVEELGVPKGTLKTRLRRGWLDDAEILFGRNYD